MLLKKHCCKVDIILFSGQNNLETTRLNDPRVVTECCAGRYKFNFTLVELWRLLGSKSSQIQNALQCMCGFK